MQMNLALLERLFDDPVLKCRVDYQKIVKANSLVSTWDRPARQLEWLPPSRRYLLRRCTSIRRDFFRVRNCDCDVLRIFFCSSTPTFAAFAVRGLRNGVLRPHPLREPRARPLRRTVSAHYLSTVLTPRADSLILYLVCLGSPPRLCGTSMVGSRNPRPV